MSDIRLACSDVVGHHDEVILLFELWRAVFDFVGGNGVEGRARLVH